MVNVDILGISELKWTGMGEFHSDDHYIYYCGQESLRRGGAWTWEFLQGPAQSQLPLFFDTHPSRGKVEWDKKGKKVLGREVYYKL